MLDGEDVRRVVVQLLLSDEEFLASRHDEVSTGIEATFHGRLVVLCMAAHRPEHHREATQTDFAKEATFDPHAVSHDVVDHVHGDRGRVREVAETCDVWCQLPFAPVDVCLRGSLDTQVAERNNVFLVVLFDSNLGGLLYDMRQKSSDERVEAFDLMANKTVSRVVALEKVPDVALRRMLFLHVCLPLSFTIPPSKYFDAEKDSGQTKMSKSFEVFLKKSLNLLQQHPGTSVEVFRMPHMVAWMREVYVSLGPLKRIAKGVWEQCIKEDFVRPPKPQDKEFLESVRYTMGKIKAFENSSDLTIRRWAQAALELDTHPVIIEKFVEVAERREDIKTYVSMGIQMMTSECISHGHIFQPYDLKV